MNGLGIPQGVKDLGPQATPPYVVLPGPSAIFLTRSKRLRSIAAEHPLAPYLSFVAILAKAQASVQAGLPPAGHPRAEQIQQAIEHGVPPLARATFEPGEAGEAMLRGFLEGLRPASTPAGAGAAIQLPAGAACRQAAPDHSRGAEDTPAKYRKPRARSRGPTGSLCRLAAQLTAAELKPIADSVCPACGSPPMTSSVVGWPGAHNSRYCTCSLCGTMWNVVRVKCVLCSSTEGIAYHSVEGSTGTVKAETCEKCGKYVKILYQVKDHMLDPLADDVATLELDMLLAKEGWKRGGNNPFLLGY